MSHLAQVVTEETFNKFEELTLKSLEYQANIIEDLKYQNEEKEECIKILKDKVKRAETHKEFVVVGGNEKIDSVHQKMADILARSTQALTEKMKETARKAAEERINREL